MQETWRWFGPRDRVTLRHVVQSGATGVVTSLHHIATGDVWPLDDILKHKAEIESHGLEWSVVESVPLHNDIKLRRGECQKYIDNYRDTLKNLSSAGIDTVCYNFMPVVDWTRTNLNYRLPNEAEALRFEMTDFAAYDIYVLQRSGAESCYENAVLAKAGERFQQMSNDEIASLEKNIIAGLPGGDGSYNRDSIRNAITEFSELGTDKYRENLFAFLKDIIPTAEREGIKMCIHPDDPPFSLFGLPRVVSTESDALAIVEAVPSLSNGLTMCAGSYGARGDNDLVQMIRSFGPHIFFVHLRNVKREEDGSFYESDHLQGDNDMLGIMSALLDEEHRRRSVGDQRLIPMRPDHGHTLADEAGIDGVSPGYSYAGRMKSLAELRGVLYALEATRS